MEIHQQKPGSNTQLLAGSTVKSKLFAMLGHRCPRCHTGRLFETTIASLRKPFHMQPFCPECKQSNYPEPGFYYGAMFISYIITAFYCLAFVGVYIVFFGLSVEASFGLLLLSLLLLYIWFYRTSRAIWIHINMRYDPGAIDKARMNPSASTPVYAHRNF